ncbi:MAG: GNAT family N-acetyltransferase [Actinomycetota bacterium]
MAIERLTLTTRRLQLEPHQPARVHSLWQATRLSLPELLPWMPWAGSASLETTKTFCDRTMKEWDAGTAYEFVFIQNDSVVGSGGLHAVLPIAARAELGYWIRSDRTGEGLCTEAAKAIRDFAFDRLNLDRLALRAGIDNSPSRRVAEKIGFQLEGHLREDGIGSNGRYDCALYGLLSSDPRPQ